MGVITKVRIMGFTVIIMSDYYVLFDGCLYNWDLVRSRSPVNEYELQWAVHYDTKNTHEFVHKFIKYMDNILCLRVCNTNINGCVALTGSDGYSVQVDVNRYRIIFDIGLHRYIYDLHTGCKYVSPAHHTISYDFCSVLLKLIKGEYVHCQYKYICTSKYDKWRYNQRIIPKFTGYTDIEVITVS